MIRDRSTFRSRSVWLGMGFALALVFAVSAAAQGSGNPNAPDLEAAAKGKLIYDRYCTVCHGKGGTGDGPLATELRTAPADLTRLAAKNGGVFPAETVARAVDGRGTTRAHGTPDMPAWGEILSHTGGTEASSVESAVARITQYIWSIQKLASD
jgi:mono/diheme cytochrome c family protein